MNYVLGWNSSLFFEGATAVVMVLQILFFVFVVVVVAVNV